MAPLPLRDPGRLGDHNELMTGTPVASGITMNS